MADDKRLTIGDIVLGPTTFHGEEVKLIETAEFARLREIKQLCTVYFFHPNATHTRWDHSIGVAALLKSFIAAQSAFTIDLESQSLLMAAALLHDIGHSAWSHVGEVFASMRGEAINHDDLSCELVRGATTYDKYFDKWDLPRVRDVITDVRRREMIAKLIQGQAPVVPPVGTQHDEATKREITISKAYMGNIIKGPADFDRAEFLMRDAFMSLTAHGLVNLQGLLEDIGIVKTATGSRILAYLNLHLAECMIAARELLYQGVYLERRNLVAEELLIRALLRAYPVGSDIYNFWFSTDGDVMERLHEAAENDPFVERVCKLFRACKTYENVMELNLLNQRLQAQARENIRYLGSKLGRRKILDLEKDVCNDLRIPLGDVVIGCWLWTKPPISDAAIQVDGRDSTVDFESRFLEALGNPGYVDSRSRLIVGVWEKSPVNCSDVLDAVMHRLNRTDYRTY